MSELHVFACEYWIMMNFFFSVCQSESLKDTIAMTVYKFFLPSPLGLLSCSWKGGLLQSRHLRCGSVNVQMNKSMGVGRKTPLLHASLTSYTLCSFQADKNWSVGPQAWAAIFLGYSMCLLLAPKHSTLPRGLLRGHLGGDR